jgi:hypothetical protein
MPLSYEELKTQVDFAMLEKLAKGLNVYPSQLFNFDEIKKDREFAKEFEEINTLKQEKENLTKEIETFKTENQNLNRSIQLNSAKGKLKELYKESQLTENMQKFIDEIYDEQKDKLEDLSDEGLKAFVENQTKIYQKATNTIENKNDVQLPTGDDQTDVEGHDSTKKASNPFLDADYNENDYT